MTARWERDSIVVWRYVWAGRVQVALPSRVVSDDGSSVALYTAGGTRGMFTRGTPAEILRTLWAGRWELAEKRYARPGLHVLHLLEAGMPFEVRLVQDEEGRLIYWYGNLQAPFRRTPHGFDTTDHVLDLVLAPDLGSWQWKDADDLVTAHRHGAFSAQEVRAIRRAGEQLLQRARDRAYPFDGTWASWRPDPSWPLPALPAEWNFDAGHDL